MFLVCLVVTLILIDQFTKYLVVANLKDLVTIPIKENIFHFTYVENRGAAFNFLKGQRWFLTVFAIIIVIVLVILIKKRLVNTKIGRFGLCFIIAGSLGNAIDRIVRGFVVDFIDLRVINFAVFNFADILICVGAALLAIYIIFQSEDKKKEKDEQLNADNPIKTDSK